MTDTLYISCSAVDRPIALKVFHALAAAGGLRPWLDVKNLQPLNNWAAECEKALHSSRAVLAVLSDNSIALKRLRGEWQWAHQNGVPLLILSFLSETEMNERLPLDYLTQNVIMARQDLDKAIAEVPSTIARLLA